MTEVTPWKGGCTHPLASAEHAHEHMAILNRVVGVFFNAEILLWTPAVYARQGLKTLFLALGAKPHSCVSLPWVEEHIHIGEQLK